jgi:hypothetical protein
MSVSGPASSVVLGITVSTDMVDSLDKEKGKNENASIFLRQHNVRHEGIAAGQ